MGQGLITSGWLSAHEEDCPHGLPLRRDSLAKSTAVLEPGAFYIKTAQLTPYNKWVCASRRAAL